MSDNKDYFNYQYKDFKEMLIKEFPDFTVKEILKFDENFHKFKEIYSWSGVHDFLAALEFEERKIKL